MVQHKNAPKEATPFARLLGCTKLGKFDNQTKVYTLKIPLLNPEAINFFKTVHGGCITGLFDDACGMTIYFYYGVNSAITESIDIKFFYPLHPKHPLSIVCKIEKEEGEKIFMVAEARSNGRVIAIMKSVWKKRSKKFK